MAPALLVILAALMGAGGVILAAVSAHAVPNAGLDSAGNMLSLMRPPCSAAPPFSMPA